MVTEIVFSEEWIGCIYDMVPLEEWLVHAHAGQDELFLLL